MCLCHENDIQFEFIHLSHQDVSNIANAIYYLFRQLGIHHRVSSSSENSLPTPLPLVENVNIAPSPRKMALKSSSFRSFDGSLSDKFSGLKSVHFVGKLDSPPGMAIF